MSIYQLNDLKPKHEIVPDDDCEALLSCKKCGELLIDVAGEKVCPHCRSKRGKCDSCGHVTPIYDGICDGCRSSARKQLESRQRLGEVKGRAVEFFGKHMLCFVVTIGSLSLLTMALVSAIPLFHSIEKDMTIIGHDMSKLINDVHGGVAPILDEGGRVLGYAGRNTASALRLLETPLNFTETKLENAESIIKRIFEAIESPTAALMAYNRVTGTTIICDDGTEYSWKPMVMKSGIVTNPYSNCVLHQMELNDVSKAKFFPGPAPTRGQPILAEKTVVRSPYRASGTGGTVLRGDHGSPLAHAG